MVSTRRRRAFETVEESAVADDRRDAIERFADALGRPPLVLHSRHIAPSSPYIDRDEDWWVDLLAAQPKDPDFFAQWFADAARWGACCVEQDWMLMYWFGVRELRARRPTVRSRGRARSIVTPVHTISV